MRKMLVRLDINTFCPGPERRKKIIDPINKVLGSEGKVIFKMPEYFLNDCGERELKKVSLDISICDLQTVSKLSAELSRLGLLEDSRLTFSDNEYDLLKIIS